MGANRSQIGILLLAIIVVVSYVYSVHAVFYANYGASAFGWLVQSWNARNELEHGPFVPFIILPSFVERAPMVSNGC